MKKIALSLVALGLFTALPGFAATPAPLPAAIANHDGPIRIAVIRNLGSDDNTTQFIAGAIQEGKKLGFKVSTFLSNGDDAKFQDFVNQAISQKYDGIILSQGRDPYSTALVKKAVDAGIKVAVFDTAVRMPGDKFSYALNQRLPEDIRVRKSYEVSPHWHPRKCSSKKTYEYRIFNDEFPDPLCRLYTHFTYTKLDIDRMNAAAGYLIGEHDFKSFCSIHTQTETTVRTITDLSVKKEGSLITIRVTGTGFLYNMVRIIAGTLIEVGNGKYPPEHIKEILKHCDRSCAGPTAPARGLTLVEYEFL